ncbi:hypothetical protein VTL71DRAFT_13662 [Oculimacula yallundae]|uniref:BTB domain-containing protein n=1 Tax=Oculimacula yallundae TaxID=86028 RepID=A0ABR4CN57_9HELO
MVVTLTEFNAIMTQLTRIISPIFSGNGIPTEEELHGGWTERAPCPDSCPLHGQIHPKSPGDSSASNPSTSTVAASKRASQEPDDSHHHKRRRLLNSLGDVIICHIGPTLILSVHRDVLLSTSPGLSKLCEAYTSQNDWTLVLFNQCPDTLRTLFYWMYHNEICISRAISQRPSSHPDPLQTASGLFVKLYIAASIYSMSRLCNDAIDALLSGAQTSDLVKLSTYVYGNTKPGSNLRKLLVKVVSCRYDEEDLLEHRQLICSEFLFDLTRAAFKDRDQGFNRFRDRLPPQEGFCATFHVHEKGEMRCEMMKGYVVAD